MMKISTRLLMMALAISLSGVVGVPAGAAPEAELISFWDARDEASNEAVDHTLWQELLDAYLQADHPSGINRFDYAALNASTEDRSKLSAYLKILTGMDPRALSKDEQMAYWINLYNALTVFVIIPRYPVESIREIKSGLIDFGPWNLELFPLQGKKLTLNQIEHGILRPIWKDPRIHYAVNCASLGCPNLSPQAYRADNLEKLLEQGAKEYVNHPRGVQVKDGKLIVSSIFEWYKVDFGNTDAGVLAHLKRYARPELAEILVRYDSFGDDYDWNLNAP